MAEDPLWIERPQRWDVPFGADMTDQIVQELLATPLFRRIDPNKFPAAVPLWGILRNDARVVRFQPGDIVVRRGDYGNSAFFILSGKVRVVVDPLPDTQLGRRETRKKSFFEALAQLWRNPPVPEARRVADSDDPRLVRRGEDGATHIVLQDIPAVLNHHRTAVLEGGEMFGELAALGRTPRTATVFADGEALLLELRWQGLRDIMRRDDTLKKHIDQIFRERALQTFLRSTPFFKHLSPQDLAVVAANTQFESFGRYDSAGSFKDLAGPGADAATRLENEPVIVEEGHYPNGLVMLRSGLGRVSRRVNHGHQTVSYLVPGQVFGYEEIAQNWRQKQATPLRYSLRALGYVNVVLVPTAVVEEYVLGKAPRGRRPLPLARPAPPEPASPEPARQPAVGTDMLEFLVDHRFINGTATMVIDLNRCTRCDDCVRACSGTHGNNPRFLRQGPTHGHYMVANACMHCLDPVCMIECPTGAIHRERVKGNVVINDDTCIGCSACARNCPYEAIRMVEIRDRDGRFILDRHTCQTIAKATKCDLCVDQWGGPACQRACPHDALQRMDMRNPGALAGWLNR